MNKKKEEGVSLIITFWIMTIALAMFLGVALILISEIKIIKNSGDIVVAYYSAESGIEKMLYLDRKQVPGNSRRGFCNICNICPDQNDGCKDCFLSGDDCSIEVCKDCQISYKHYFDDKMYEIEASVSPADASFSNFNVYSKGIYKNAIRAINLDILKKETKPYIINTFVVLSFVEGGISLDISADVIDADGVNPDSIIAHIQNPDENDIETITLALYGENTYKGSWTGPSENYYIDISACDNLGNCATKNNI